MKDTTLPYNTSLEAGLRALFLLCAAGKASLDTQRLMYYDYAMVHTADFDGPRSLHPPTPSQGSQLLVRRALLQEGLELMRSRDLVERRFLVAGITWRPTAAGVHVMGQFTSAYALRLRERAHWVVGALGDRTETQLIQLFAERVPRSDTELITAHDIEPLHA